MHANGTIQMCCSFFFVPQLHLSRVQVTLDSNMSLIKDQPKRTARKHPKMLCSKVWAHNSALYHSIFNHRLVYLYIIFHFPKPRNKRCRIIWNILSVWRSRISWSVLLVCLCFRDRKWSNTNFCLSKAEPSCDSHLTISSGNVARQGACLSWVGKAHKAYT